MLCRYVAAARSVRSAEACRLKTDVSPGASQRQQQQANRRLAHGLCVRRGGPVLQEPGSTSYLPRAVPSGSEHAICSRCLPGPAAVTGASLELRPRWCLASRKRRPRCHARTGHHAVDDSEGHGIRRRTGSVCDGLSPTSRRRGIRDNRHRRRARSAPRWYRDPDDDAPHSVFHGLWTRPGMFGPRR